MKTLIYESWTIEYDDVLTREIFKDMISGPQNCGCDNCKNFMLARDQVYPESLKEILNQLGIDYQKETEICYFNCIEAGWHFYKGWFHFIGEIQKAPEDGGFSIYGRVPDMESFAWSFQCNKRDLAPKEFGQFPVVQLDWLRIVPWFIENEELT